MKKFIIGYIHEYPRLTQLAVDNPYFLGIEEVITTFIEIYRDWLTFHHSELCTDYALLRDHTSAVIADSATQMGIEDFCYYELDDYSDKFLSVCELYDTSGAFREMERDGDWDYELTYVTEHKAFIIKEYS